MIDNSAVITNTQHQAYYIGLMSGTSADGIDLAIVSFDEYGYPTMHTSYYQAYSKNVAYKIHSLYNPGDNEIDRAFELDVELAHLFAQAIEHLLSKAGLTSNDILAIGNHGQTIRHRPQSLNPFTLQIGCSQTLATLTEIRVIGQFRRKDMALGGQGAPLVPAFHEKIFNRHSIDNHCNTFIVNIGGIANLTFLPQDKTMPVIGYDTGTGNALMDEWFQCNHPNSDHNFDFNGDWANEGQVNSELLSQMLSDNYFTLAPPKSTGREYFNILWLEQHLAKMSSISPKDVQATLTAFTAQTLVGAINQHLLNEKIPTEIYLCGGGAKNSILKQQINQQLALLPQKYSMLMTEDRGIDGDQLESIAFAWLAYAYDKKLLSNMPSVTGASKACTLGTAYQP